MRIFAADDETLALEMLVQAIGEAEPDAVVHAFSAPSELLAFAANNPCDVAFLDIQMSGTTGMELAKKLKQLVPAAKIVFITGHAQYASEAYSIHADGYMMKPVSAEKLLAELEHLKNVAPLWGKRVRVNCFGNFEVWLDGEPMKFRYSKTKELLAYLIDRNGALCSGRELAAVLWEDEGNKKTYYLKRLRADLLDAFDAADCSECIERRHGQLGVVPDRFDCDYFDRLAGKAVGTYRGEYMAQYSWGERTLGQMENTEG